jgi:hypothetical protein
MNTPFSEQLTPGGAERYNQLERDAVELSGALWRTRWSSRAAERRAINRPWKE